MNVLVCGIEQGAVMIDQMPVLGHRQKRREGAQIRSGSAAQIEYADMFTAVQMAEQVAKQRFVARTVIRAFT